MVASGFFVFNVAPIHWCEQIKTKNTGLRSKARVSMLGLNQFLGKRVSVIPPGSQNKAKSPISYRFGAFFIVKPQAENMKEF
jgi:hypothetical protein